MGAKRHRKKYATPSHPWQRERIEEEKGLVSKYGIRRKYELWKMKTILKNFTNQAKTLMKGESTNNDKEAKQLMERLSRLGLMDRNAQLSQVLGLKIENVLDRRLQTLVDKKNFARSASQARQFITHGHIIVGGKKISAPSYLVPVAEEATIQFVDNSSLANPEHPERAIAPEEKEKKKQQPKKGEKKAERKEDEDIITDEEIKEAVKDEEPVVVIAEPEPAAESAEAKEAAEEDK
ncbi:30S ribosomal protein S4 [Candidatus Woesearchaeota archaeon]|nr:30S ribosomal protein S4 [Candidatus Woesearchaeota archaeon]